MAVNDGGPAFPHPAAFGYGMTLRDYCAAKVLPAIYAEDSLSDGDMTLDEMAHEAYRMADAMLAARSKEA